MENNNNVLYFKYEHTITDFYAGDSLNWNIQFSNFKPSDGYVLDVYLLSRDNTKNQFRAVSDDTGTIFNVSCSSVETMQIQSGQYLCFLILSKAGFTKQLEHGYIKVQENIMNIPDIDKRTHAEKMIELINLRLENKIGDDAANYSINGRQLTKYSWKELLELKREYIAEIERYKREREIAEKGYTNRNKLKVNFVPSWKFRGYRL